MIAETPHFVYRGAFSFRHSLSIRSSMATETRERDSKIKCRTCMALWIELLWIYSLTRRYAATVENSLNFLVKVLILIRLKIIKKIQ